MAGEKQRGSLGIGPNNKPPDAGTTAITSTPTPGTVGGAATADAAPPPSADTILLAATAYGEGSSKDVLKEMAAIANVLVRQQKARGYASIGTFIRTDKTFAFAAHDGNQRYARLVAATPEQIALDKGMTAALEAATNALSANPIDYSNGAYFWDGADIKTNYARHPKVRAGILITDKSHNIYAIDSKKVPGEVWWTDAKGTKTKLRGTWDYKYESTAAHGGTIFWKYNQDFLKASGNKEYN